MNNLFNLENKIIIVTGALGFLGFEYARYLLEQGAWVASFDLPDRPYKPLGFEKHLIFSVDVRNKLSVEIAYSLLEKKWGVPHGLINNAAIDFPPKISLKNFEDYSEKEWLETISVNLFGVITCCQVIGSKMAQAGRGSIINIGSIYGMHSPDQRIYANGFQKPISYTASKAALYGVTKYLATLWAKNNCRVNILTLAGVLNNQPEEFIQKYIDKIPMGKMADKTDYNGAIHFLLSEASNYMTGSNLIVDGGFSAW